jgi:hypothetical protein
MITRMLLPLAFAGSLALADASADSRVVDRPTAAAAADSVREYRGTYATGFEVSWFHPCGAPVGDDMWWVTLTDEALRQRDSLARTLSGPPGAVYVRWRGTISDRMPAGHMGRGSRYMLVVEVLELRPATEAACSAA